MLVDYAIKYSEHGFSVIPIGQNKRPLIKFADRPSLTVKQIKQIWAKYPNANIAIKTEQFFVIDVDRHGNNVDGLNSIRELNHPEWFRNTLAEKTAHNGFHFFFQKPINEKITQNIGFLPGVDLKAHPNNYIVVAPSRINGNPYQWLNHCPIKTAPQGLINLIRSRHQAKDTLYKTNSNKTKTAQLFEMITTGLGEVGNRNDTLTSFIGGLLFRGVDPYSVAELAHIVNEHTPDPLPEKEVIKTINSVAKKENRRC
ncbi:bifunctional DNA primase/polymerase [Lactobacillus laiwuensis]|uniref:bifunctional DNA primase/polymerase n=1 Tax=Lactobacillus laiwuensis TaxID=2841034 RepID=UPI001CC47802|nr:bifunctional DNA primase/polymerase [Lactobacillus laiwuensis]